MRRLLITALACAACGHPTATPTTGSATATPTAPLDAPRALDQDLPRLAALALALYEAIAAAFVTTGVACDAATTQLDALATTFADVTAANAKVLREHRGKELRAALDPLQDRFDAAAKAIMSSPTLATCAPDKAFETAFDRLLEPPP
ncbi:MAG: hypothetical protein NT062_22630 [Proteobacteria bacterium]|nr:hypothetical protein [Pseudomonadota bacterium]